MITKTLRKLPPRMEVIFRIWICRDIPIFGFDFLSENDWIDCQLFGLHKSSYRAMSVAQDPETGKKTISSYGESVKGYGLRKLEPRPDASPAERNQEQTDYSQNGERGAEEKRRRWAVPVPQNSCDKTCRQCRDTQGSIENPIGRAAKALGY